MANSISFEGIHTMKVFVISILCGSIAATTVLIALRSNSARERPPIEAAAPLRSAVSSENREELPWDSATTTGTRADLIRLRTIAGSSDSIQRSRLLQEAVKGLSAATCAALVGSLPPAEIASELGLYLTRKWAEESPIEASRWAEGLKPREARAAALTQIALGFATTQPTEAATWAARLPAGEERDRVVAMICGELSRTEPLSAIELASSTLGSAREYPEIVAQAASQWAAQDSKSALAWALQCTDESLRPVLIEAIAPAIADRDGPAALLLAEQMPDDEAAYRVATVAIARWAERDPRAAADFVEKLDHGFLRDEIASQLITIWEKYRPTDAAAWKVTQAR